MPIVAFDPVQSGPPKALASTSSIGILASEAVGSRLAPWRRPLGQPFRDRLGLSLEKSRSRIQALAKPLLAAALLSTILVGGTEIGRLSTEARMLFAAIGALLVANYVHNLPKRNDAVDRLALGALALFLLACVLSTDPRASFDAATSALTYAAAFYVARGALATDENRRSLITLLGMAGIVLGVAFLVVWGSIWMNWIAATGTAPPFDLPLPAFVFRHQYAAAMLAVLLLPATITVAQRRVIRLPALVGTASLAIVVLMSGSRMIWAAAGTAALIAIVGNRQALGSAQRRGLRMSALAAGLVVLSVVAVPLLSRLSATSTIELRMAMWTSALRHWLDSLVAGSGPGSFAREFAATGFYARYDDNVPHAHNAAVQIAFEGGLLGLAALSLLGLALFLGARRARRLHWSWVAAIAFVVFASLADNPTVVPFIVVLIIVWAAFASPRAVVAASTTGNRVPVFASRGLLLVVGAAVAATLAGSWAYDRAREAADTGNASSVIANLRRATFLDPSSALYHRELGTWLGSTDNASARDELQTAVALNPSDTAAQRALALNYADDERPDIAQTLIADLAAVYASRTEDALTAAHIALTAGDEVAAHWALVNAVEVAPWLTASDAWAAAYPSVDVARIVRDAYAAWAKDDAHTARTLQAGTWLAAMAGRQAPELNSPALQLQRAVIECDMRLATHLTSVLATTQQRELEAIRAQLLYARLAGKAEVGDLIALLGLRDPGMERIANVSPAGVGPTESSFYDNRYYDRLAIDTPIPFALPTSASGMSAWLRSPVDAAHRGAPESGLAHCR
jgi:O-antigen ligase